MRNNKQTLLVALCTLLTYSAAMSQVDVTALYLKNAGFDTNYDYKVGVTGNVTQEMLPVDGWINDYSVNYTIVGTYQVKTQKTFNGASVPTTNVDGTTEGGVLALSTGWSESIKLYQNVSLPKGEYSIVTAYYNSGSVTAGNSLFGWIPSSGTSIMSTVSDFPIKKWTVALSSQSSSLLSCPHLLCHPSPAPQQLSAKEPGSFLFPGPSLLNWLLAF